MAPSSSFNVRANRPRASTMQVNGSGSGNSTANGYSSSNMNPGGSFKSNGRPSPSPGERRSMSLNKVQQQQQMHQKMSQDMSSSPPESRPSQSRENSSQSQPTPSAPRQFKLVSVNFKEAALDSPSFRASVNHLDTQVDNIEKWLSAIDSSVRKIPKYVKELQTFSNSFLEHLVPTFLQDGMIDQEYTVQALHSTLSSLTKLWNTSISALSFNSYLNENLNAKLFKAIKHYRDLRTVFEIVQQKYDQYLAIYVSTSKTKEASIVLEDAKQLFHVRREYIEVSLELITEISTLGNTIDRALVRYCTDLWKTKRTNLLSVEGLDPVFSLHVAKMNKIQGWCDTYSIAAEKLKSDMITAREQVKESTILQFSPSLNLDDYRISLINAKVLGDISDSGIEKHGYLFMKTYGERSSKPIWVRRWAFIKGGVFGLLVLSPSQTFVQETDKIGVLLCNIKYVPYEERKFCFEVKTLESTFVFQAETLYELKSWLKVFENEMHRVLQENDPNTNDLLNIASGRYPPIVTEFASTVNTTSDREFTNTKVINSVGQIITSSKLSHQIEKNERLFKRHIYHQIPQIRPPIITESTKSSIIAYSLAAANTLPTALTANIWGSANWGLYHLHEVPPLIRDSPKSQAKLDAVNEETLKLDSDSEGICYPDFYPYELVPLDIQMRALFETAVEPGELCLISFRCIWAPNSRQELSGRCFITNRHIYFYMHSLGFTALTKLPVEHLVAADYSSRQNHDILKIYNMNGVVKMKLFLDNGKLIKNKLTYLIENNASDHPQHFHEMINNLVKLDNQFELEQKNELQNKVIAKNTGVSVDSLNLRQHQQYLKQQKACHGEIDEESMPINLYSFTCADTVALDGASANGYKIDFSDTMHLLSEQVYNIPPKAMFHALLGDNANTLDSYTTFTHFESRVQVPWTRLPNNGGLMRKYNRSIIHDGRKAGKLQITDHLDGLVEDEYYSFTHEKASCKFLCGAPYNIKYRFVCLRVPGNKTSVSVYIQIYSRKISLLSKIIRPICFSVCRKEINKVEKGLRDAVAKIGVHGTIIKSIYLYGKLSSIDQVIEVDDVEPIVFGPQFFVKLLIKKSTLFVVGKISVFVHFIFNLIITMLKSIRANQVLLLMIAGLSLINLFLAGKTTTSYWTSRRATQVAQHLLTKDPVMLKRAVYLKDTQEIVRSMVGDLSSDSDAVCYKAFKNVSFVLNYDKFDGWNSEYGDENTRQVAKSLKKSFQDIGVKRHQLLVDLKMLNEMEQELAKAEWRNWLMSELSRCEYIKQVFFNQVLDDNASIKEFLQDLDPGREAVMKFCDSCAANLRHADSLL